MTKKIKQYLSPILSTAFLLIHRTALAATDLKILGYDFQKTSSEVGFLDIIGFVLYLGRNLIGIAGFIAIIYMMIGGFSIMYSGGNQDQVQKGKNTLTYAIFGFIVAVTAFLLVTSLMKYLTGITLEQLPTSSSAGKTTP
ncbi:MAG TPA: hypothetical protein PLZ62_04160 [bacterium]|nr:hypothetical protein [bacterium]